MELKTTEYKTALISVSTLNNQLEIKQQNLLQLNLEKRQMQKQLDDLTKQNNFFKNDSLVLQKQIEENKEEIQKNKLEIEEKNKIINEQNEKIKNMENEFNEKLKSN